MNFDEAYTCNRIENRPVLIGTFLNLYSQDYVPRREEEERKIRIWEILL